MGKKATIDREKLLDLAERIVREKGTKALTIDALAKAASISKGGVQYNFPSKDALIRALVMRWTSRFDAMIGSDDAAPSATGMIRRYLDAMRASGEDIDAKIAGVMITLSLEPENLIETREWYREFLNGFDLGSAEGRRARLAFLAIEGAFQMRALGLSEHGDWESMLHDIEALLDLPQAAPEG